MQKQGDILKGLSKKQVTFHLMFTQCLLIAVSIGLGYMLIGDLDQWLKQFDFHMDVLWIGGAFGILVVTADLIMMKLLPSRYYDDGGVNERIFADRGFFEIMVLAFIIAVSEELLFRGILQFHFGLMVASIVFAVIHIRYWAHWFLIVNVLTLSFVMGIIYDQTGNLLVTIVMHFVIDFLLGLYMRHQARSEE
ncbi:CPBP family intramembrane glutamic endopeptidase [Rossellomorea marisflavi]|uniref:CPBP family intramembrane glutamic endopeptidase n=1 Tax=Rossellomorea TaxID=2837508 RepID=UPI002570CB34|nr:CPBP family intramembrane glutamic endopeptidase [Rossellomorea marisflavi]MDW4527194.1 CPBP family intramembrane glutamic endopeptidase [Rossellomorea marisflavi]